MAKHEAALAKAADAYRKAGRDLEAARERLATEIRAAASDKMRQVDILRATGDVWTREQVRQVCLRAES